MDSPCRRTGTDPIRLTKRELLVICGRDGDLSALAEFLKIVHEIILENFISRLEGFVV